MYKDTDTSRVAVISLCQLPHNKVQTGFHVEHVFVWFINLSQVSLRSINVLHRKLTQHTNTVEQT